MKVTRKGFIGTGLLAFGGYGLFNIGYAAGRRPKPSDRVNLAVIGCGTQGFANMGVFLQDKRVQITTVCDPVLSAGKYSYRSEKTCGRAPAKAYVDDFYKNKDCRMVADFREVLADPSVDAVLIATPDHWHAIQSIMAMKAGKHVYCQKPMSLGISEGKEMARVAKETGVTFQVGSQQRSASAFRVAAELVASGYIGECMSCEIGLPGGNKGMYGHEKSARSACRAATRACTGTRTPSAASCGGRPTTSRPRRCGTCGRDPRSTGRTTPSSKASTTRCAGASTRARAAG